MLDFLEDDVENSSYDSSGWPHGRTGQVFYGSERAGPRWPKILAHYLEALTHLENKGYPSVILHASERGGLLRQALSKTGKTADYRSVASFRKRASENLRTQRGISQVPP